MTDGTRAQQGGEAGAAATKDLTQRIEDAAREAVARERMMMSQLAQESEANDLARAEIRKLEERLMGSESALGVAAAEAESARDVADALKVCSTPTTVRGTT